MCDQEFDQLLRTFFRRYAPPPDFAERVIRAIRAAREDGPVAKTCVEDCGCLAYGSPDCGDTPIS